MTYTHTNKTVQTENVSNGKVILKGCISGQKQTRLSKQEQWRTFRQFSRVSEENYFDQFSWIQCSKLGENLGDICKQHSAWRTGGRTLKKHVNFTMAEESWAKLENWFVLLWRNFHALLSPRLRQPCSVQKFLIAPHWQIWL